jgi:hypothetical protein
MYRFASTQKDHIILHEEGTHSLYNFVTDNFKEYDLDTEYCLNIDKYLVCEGRDMMMPGGSGAYNSFKIFNNYFIHLELA